MKIAVMGAMVEEVEPRITSYNVCYTKLLRENVLNALESNDEVVLTHIEHCPNITLLFERVKTDKVRMIATASSEYLSDAIWEFFSVKIALPPLVDRPEDVELRNNFV